MSVKVEFCKMAREMLNEELMGKGEYGKFNEKLEDLITEQTDPSTEMRLIAYSRKINDIQHQEGEHGTFLAILIADQCKGI